MVAVTAAASGNRSVSILQESRPKFRREMLESQSMESGRGGRGKRAAQGQHKGSEATAEGARGVIPQIRIPQWRAAWAAAALVGTIVMFAGASIARAQEVVVLVDGMPITKYDIAERTKLEQMSSPKPPVRQEVIDGLIDEILELNEAKRFGVEVPATQVDDAYANVAKHLGVDAQKLTQILTKAGASEATLKHRLQAQLAWNALVRGRYSASLQIADSDIEAQLQLHKSGAKDNVGYEYTIRPIVFIVPVGASAATFATRKREADALRARFSSCADGLPFARALNGVAVRDQVIKFSADLPEESRQILDGTPIGHLTPPETTGEGVQMFAICGKRSTTTDTPEKHEIREQIFQKRFGAQAARYLARLRSRAMIQYR
jgi:peptidyl-prolyl cis-trans isomerase SurA